MIRGTVELCSSHKKKAKLLCEECSTLLCVECVTLPVHKGHAFATPPNQPAQLVEKLYKPFEFNFENAKKYANKIQSIDKTITEISRLFEMIHESLLVAEKKTIFNLNTQQSLFEKELVHIIIDLAIEKYEPKDLEKLLEDSTDKKFELIKAKLGKAISDIKGACNLKSTQDLSNVEKHNPNNNRWGIVEPTRMKRACSSASAACTNEHINDTPNAFERFNINSRKRDCLDSIPTKGGSSLACCYDNGRYIYLVGGIQNNITMDGIDKFDILTGKCVQVGNNVKAPILIFTHNQPKPDAFVPVQAKLSRQHLQPCRRVKADKFSASRTHVHQSRR